MGILVSSVLISPRRRREPWKHLQLVASWQGQGYCMRCCFCPVFIFDHLHKEFDSRTGCVLRLIHIILVTEQQLSAAEVVFSKMVAVVFLR